MASQSPPASAAFLEDFQRQVNSSGGAEQPPAVRRRAGGAEGSQAPLGSDALVRDLLRFTLYRSQDVTQLMNAQSLAFLLSSEEAKRSIKENIDAYRNKYQHLHGGDVEAARVKAREDKAALQPHQWGPKNTFNTVILLRCFKQLRTGHLSRLLPMSI